MTKFTGKSFSVAVGSPNYRENFDRIFSVDRTKLPAGYSIRMLETGGHVSFLWFTAAEESGTRFDSRQETIDAAWRHFDSED